MRRYTYDAGKARLPIGRLESNLPAHNDHGGGRVTFGPRLRKSTLRAVITAANWLRTLHAATDLKIFPRRCRLVRVMVGLRGTNFVRMNLDGTIPADNPLLNGVRSHIYSYGHRNPQGLAFGPNGLLYSSEHGPGTDDEVNLILAGRNYGWPHVAGYRDDRGYVYANWSQSKGGRAPVDLR